MRYGGGNVSHLIVSGVVSAVLYQSRQQTVLIVDPRQEIVHTLNPLLAERGYRIAVFSSSTEAKHWLAEHQPNVIVVSGSGDLERDVRLTREFFGGGSLPRPLVFLVAPDMHDPQDARTLVAHGADDVIPMPVDPQLFLARLEVHLHYHKSLVQLQRRNELLTRLAAFDELTRLFNRRSFLEALEVSLERAAIKDMPVALFLIDIDHFKLINDRYGHHVGDAALRELAHRLGAPLRQDDIIGRYGGEEFSALIYNVSLEQSLVVAERLRTSVCAEPIIAEGRVIPVTTSVGVAWMPGKVMATSDRLLRCADSALYEAKQSGRNRVVVRNLETAGDGECQLPPSADKEDSEDYHPSDTPTHHL